MKGVSKEQITQAKQIDLLSYLKACEPQNLQAEGPHDYRHKTFHTFVSRRLPSEKTPRTRCRCQW